MVHISTQMQYFVMYCNFASKQTWHDRSFSQVKQAYFRTERRCVRSLLSNSFFQKAVSIKQQNSS